MQSRLQRHRDRERLEGEEEEDDAAASGRCCGVVMTRPSAAATVAFLCLLSFSALLILHRHPLDSSPRSFGAGRAVTALSSSWPDVRHETWSGRAWLLSSSADTIGNLQDPATTRASKGGVDRGRNLRPSRRLDPGIKRSASTTRPATGRVLMFAAVPGSYPPRCTAKCGNCNPCKPVHVPVPPGRLVITMEYYPEAWRCKCGNVLYMP